MKIIKKLVTIFFFPLLTQAAEMDTTVIQTHSESTWEYRIRLTGSMSEEKMQEKMNKMKDKLGLSDEQFEKVKALKKAKHEKKKAAWEEKKAKMKSIREEYMAGMKEILTAEQLEKYEAMKEKKGSDRDHKGSHHEYKGSKGSEKE